MELYYENDERGAYVYADYIILAAVPLVVAFPYVLLFALLLSNSLALLMQPLWLFIFTVDLLLNIIILIGDIK
jgi:hypothetical protein